MFKSRTVSISIFTILICAGFLAAQGLSAFAEDSVNCNGIIEGYTCNSNESIPGIGVPYSSEWPDCMPAETGTGKTIEENFLNPIPSAPSASWVKMGHSNPNALVTDFNAHGGSNYPSHLTDLFIAGNNCKIGDKNDQLCTKGLAPAEQSLAACLQNKDTEEPTLPTDIIYMSGYVWNTNLGFISFDCTDEDNAGTDCGKIPYGVAVGPELTPDIPVGDYDYVKDYKIPDDNIRLLEGNAWNPAFGYINFKGMGGGTVVSKNEGPYSVSRSPIIACEGGVTVCNNLLPICGAEEVDGGCSAFIDACIANPNYHTGCVGVNQVLRKYGNGFFYVCSKEVGGVPVSAEGADVSCADGFSNFDWAFIEKKKSTPGSPGTKADTVASITCTKADNNACVFPVEDGTGPTNPTVLIDSDPGTSRQVETGFERPITFEITFKAIQSINSVSVIHRSADGPTGNCGGMCPNNIMIRGKIEAYYSNGYHDILTVNNPERNPVISVGGLSLEGVSKLRITNSTKLEASGAGWRPSEIDWTPVNLPSAFDEEVERYTILLKSGLFGTANDLQNWLTAKYPETGATYEVKDASFDAPGAYVFPGDPESYSYNFSPPGKYVFVYNAVGHYLKKLSSPTTETVPEFNYGVYAVQDKENDRYWYLHGWAWTDAKVWLNFEGVRFVLPHLPNAFGNCEKTCGGCIELRYGGEAYNTADLFKYDYGYEAKPESGTGKIYPPIADGTDGYSLAVYFRDDNCNDYKLEDGYRFEITDLHTSGDIKLNQTVKGGLSALDFNPKSIKQNPLVLDQANLSNWIPETYKIGEADYTRYIYNQKIKSYAPSNGANISWTTGGTSTHYKIANNPDEISIVSSKINIGDVYFKSGMPESMQTGSGTIGMSLEFRPAVYVDKFYANSNEDKIEGLIGFPVPTYVNLAMTGSTAPTINSVEFKGSCYGSGAVLCSPPEDPHPTKGFTFAKLNGGQDLYFGNEPPLKFIKDFFIPSSAGPARYYGSGSTAIQGDLVQLDVDALKKYGDEEPLDLWVEAKAEGATDVMSLGINSIVDYALGGKPVRYYSNHLPRIPGGMDTPTVFISGQINAQKAGAASLKQDPVLTTGDALSNTVRNAIAQNLSRNIDRGASGGAVSGGTGGRITCTIGSKEIGCKISETIIIGEVIGDDPDAETVFYVNGQDVDIGSLASPNTDIAWDGKYVLVVEGGNVYINQDLYNDGDPAGDGQLVIVALRNTDEQGGSGNVYIKNDVRNIQATAIVADGAIYSYMVGVVMDPDSGEPENLTNFYSQLSNPANAYQLEIEGSIASKNTIGGALQTSEMGSDYIGRGNEITTDKEKAQLYDLNYLRLVRMGLTPDLVTGYPIDQQCGKGLSPIEINALNLCLKEAEGLEAWVPVINEENGEYCDGITVKEFKGERNPNDFTLVACNSHTYDFKGDLVTQLDAEHHARGYDELPADQQNYPTLIFYRPISSFILGTK